MGKISKWIKYGLEAIKDGIIGGIGYYLWSAPFNMSGNVTYYPGSNAGDPIEQELSAHSGFFHPIGALLMGYALFNYLSNAIRIHSLNKINEEEKNLGRRIGDLEGNLKSDIAAHIQNKYNLLHKDVDGLREYVDGNIDGLREYVDGNIDGLRKDINEKYGGIETNTKSLEETVLGIENKIKGVIGKLSSYIPKDKKEEIIDHNLKGDSDE